MLRRNRIVHVFLAARDAAAAIRREAGPNENRSAAPLPSKPCTRQGVLAVQQRLLPAARRNCSATVEVMVNVSDAGLAVIRDRRRCHRSLVTGHGSRCRRHVCHACRCCSISEPHVVEHERPSEGPGYSAVARIVLHGAEIDARCSGQDGADLIYRDRNRRQRCDRERICI